MKSKLFKKIIAGISSIAMLATMSAVPVSADDGDSTVIYERGTTTAWSESDLSDWTLSGHANATPTINATYGLYADNNQTGAVTKTFEYSDSAVITYDVDFYATSSTGRTSNYAYVKLGSNVTVGWNSNYNLYYSVDGGTTYDGTAVKTIGKAGGTTNIKAIINTSSNVLVSLSIDGTAVERAANTVLSGSTYDSVSMGFLRGGSVNWNTQYALTNVKISEVVDETVYHVVTYNVDGTATTESVADNATVAEVPETTKTGYLFKGWAKDGDNENLLSTEDVKTLEITDDVSLVAVFEKDPDYIEPIVSAVISGADLMTIGADADTSAANEYTVTLTGELDTDITKATLDSRITDFKVEWDVKGFKTANDAADNSYCDYYGGFESKTTDDVKAIFNLRKNASMNFFGLISATVTYNGTTVTATKPVAAVSNTDAPSNRILPKPGYPSDFADYSELLNGYSTTAETYGAGSDVITGNWIMSGSDDSKSATIVREGDEGYMRVSADTLKKSHVATNKITSPSNQAIFSQDVRFNSTGGTITLTAGYPFWSNNSSYGVAASVFFDGTKITLNEMPAAKDDTAAEFSPNTWYKLVLSVDKTNETAFLNVYNTEGVLLGATGNVKWSNSCNPTYYSVGIGNSNTGSIDFNNYTAYYPTADETTYTLVTTADTLSIPNGDSAELTAALKTADGYDITGLAAWTVLEDDMKDGVIITPDENDSHKATVTLSDTASPGTATVQVSIGGYIKTIELNITSSAESVKFTQSKTSISIPLDTAKKEEVIYKAIVVDGGGNDLNKTVAYAVYNKTNSEPYTLPAGITFDSATGKLTVTSAAKACTFVIRAAGTNSDGETISRAVKVTVHGLAFDFGAGTDDDVVEGYTAVTPDTGYTDARGYGITGTVTAGGTASLEDAAADWLEGAMTFKVNVPSAKLYTVDITYRGTLTAEPVNSDLTAYTLGTNTSLATATYTVPVIDDVLELTVSDCSDDNGTYTAQIASIVITKNADKKSGSKPTVYVIGDSTLQNNGSWGYWLNNNTDRFTELYNTANINICGRGGSNLSKYYTSGDFLSKILLNIKPGDVVSLGNMGTNGMGSSFEDDVNYYLDAVEALGAKVILHSYSPHGAVGDYTGGYDSDTQTFTGYRQDSYDNIIRAVAAERAENDENYLGFVDIGKRADAAFNAYVDDYAANGYESRDAAAQAIIKCFPDHNHYNSLASELMVAGYGEAKGAADAYLEILSEYADDFEPTPEVGMKYGNGVITILTDKSYENASVYVATYNADGSLASVKVVTKTLTANESATVETELAEGAKIMLWDGNTAIFDALEV